MYRYSDSDPRRPSRSSRPPRRRAPAAPVPLDESEVSLARLRVYGVLLALGILALVSRLWYLQIYKGESFHAQADNNRLRPVREVAPRGMLVDARGRTLVTNSAQFTVFLMPGDLPKDDAEKDDVLRRLAGILEMSDADLRTLMKRRDPGASNPIPLMEGVSAHILARIAENRLDLPGVRTDVEPVRAYPHGATAAHLLGTIGPLDAEDLADPATKKRGYRPGDFIGKTGVEQAYDHLLCGVAGGALFEVDRRGRQRRQTGEDPVIPGATLTLGLDLDVQKAAEAALAGRKGAAVALDPRDGRVLAYVSSPAFDPTIFAHRPLPGQTYKSLMDEGRLLDRVASRSAAQPPGSTFKVVTSAAALSSGTATKYTNFYCPGGMRLGRRTFKRCHSTHGGGVDLTYALEASCDVYYYRTGLAMGPDKIADWARKFGLGQRTGIDLPVDAKGRVPDPDWKRRYAEANDTGDSVWHPGETANVAIGQGALTTTPLQMALVAAAIGNGGTVYAPRVVTRATDPLTGKIVYEMKPTVTHRLGLSAEHLAEIAHGMRAVVAGGRGTSRRAALPGIAVAGKSGSAETAGNKYTHAWFICYAPYENPTIAICIFLDADKKNLHGGADAAPIARKMMAAHFRVKDTEAGGGRAAD